MSAVTLPHEVTDTGQPPVSARQDAESLVQQMDSARTGMLPWFRELANFFSPRSPRFDGEQDRRGHARNAHILDETPLYCRRTLVSGLAWGVTNPSSRWAEMAFLDAAYDENGAAQEWVHEVNDRMFEVLGRSNFYQSMPHAYEGVATYATAAILMEEDERDIIRFVPWAIGSYGIADDERGRVTAAYRVHWMTVRQLVKRFGTDPMTGHLDSSAFSRTVLTAIQQKQWEQRVEVCHLIQVHPDQQAVDADSTDQSKWPVQSLFWERASRPKQEGRAFLAVEGYREWPLLVYRWKRVADEPWGIDSPAMETLGGAKGLQKMRSKGLKLLDKLVDPPITGPTELEFKRVSILPGDFTAVANDREKQLRAIHEVRADGLVALTAEMEQERARLHDLWFTRLMLFITSDPRQQRPTATEVTEVSQEKYLVFGSVLESFNEVLSQMFDRLFAILERRDMLPPPPREMAGQPLVIRYTSMMAVAQRSVGLAQLERFGFQAAQLITAYGDPSAADKVDVDQLFDELGKRGGVPPGVVRSDEDVAAMRKQRAAAQEQERQVALAAEEAKAAKDASQAMIGGGETVLSRILAGSQPALGLGG